jgi:hypothetical protein
MAAPESRLMSEEIVFDNALVGAVAGSRTETKKAAWVPEAA